MKTLTDLLNLVNKQFDTSGELEPKVVKILASIDLMDEAEVQQAYRTIYNECRTKND